MNIDKIKSEFQLVNNRIININLSNNLFSVNDSKIKKEIRKLDYNYNLIDNDELHAGILQLFVEIIALEENEESALQISMGLDGCFTAGKESMDKNQFIEMLEISGTACLYSIARANIINLSSQSIIEGQLRLPMINVYDFVEGKKAERTNQDNSIE